jgi:methylthioribose-1-phosphate isomerase
MPAPSVVPHHSALPLVVTWTADGRAVRILDQRALPEHEAYLDIAELRDACDAIRTLAVRGAPAIGVFAAMVLATIAEQGRGDAYAQRDQIRAAAAQLRATRPTAVNLAWAIDRTLAVLLRVDAHDVLGTTQALRAEADAIRAEDAAMCRAIGEHGASLLGAGTSVLTHCNAGALATAGIGTALAPMYVAHERGVRVHVFANETRPLRQGARLTAWELARAGVSATVLPDGAAAGLLASGRVALVLVGADRIAVNGDTANKVGTYGVALAARAHGVPFYVAAPASTFDGVTPHGAGIPIEERDARELAPLPQGVAVWNPAFDITPASLITGFITDRGILHSPFADGANGVRPPPPRLGV